MSYLDKYNQRLNRNGNDVGEVYLNNTKAFIESTFHASPTFRVMGVKSSQFPAITQIDARVIEIEKLGNLREVIFRPNQSLDVGTYVTFDNDTWIIFDKFGSLGSSSVRVEVAKCNRILKWKDKNNNVIEIDCVASASDLGSKAKQNRNDIEWNKYDVRLALGQLFVFVEANPTTKQIKLNHRFIFGRNVYEVVGTDDTTSVNKDGFGVIQLTIKITTSQDADDFVNGIAFNDYPLEESSGGTGGGLW